MKRVLLAGALALAGCSCVARGSLILTPAGLRRIEDLQVGDEVLAVNEDTGERIPTKVTEIRRATREVGLVKFGGDELRMTSDHPVFCPEEDLYAPAGDWFLGKRTALLRVLERGTEIVAPDRVEVFVDVSEVFDITVENELHNFVAQGFLVHNKSPPNNDKVNVVTGCEVDGEFYDEGADCACPDGTGAISCEDEACLCGDAAVDMSSSDASASDASKSDAGDVGGSSDVGDSTDTGDMGVDAGAVRQRGDCVADADCAMDTWMCVAVGEDEPGAHYTCQADVVAEPGCATIEAPDQCCVHADCTDAPSGTCVIGPIFYCGGVAPQIANVCLYDECASNADCGAEEICMPPRALGEPVSRCVRAECGTDDDCSTGTGGECHMFRNPCNGRVTGFLCTYDDSECRTGDDCPEDPNTPGVDYCAPGPNGDGDTQCASFSPPP